MKKTIVAILISIFLFGAIVPVQAREDLARFPVLMHHFTEHRAEFPGTTLLQFLHLHYGAGFSNHDSNHDHSGLPLKGPVTHLHAPAALAMIVPKLLELYEPAVPVDAPVFAEYSYCFYHPSDIWQPPRAHASSFPCI